MIMFRLASFRSVGPILGSARQSFPCAFMQVADVSFLCRCLLVGRRAKEGRGSLRVVAVVQQGTPDTFVPGTIKGKARLRAKCVSIGGLLRTIMCKGPLQPSNMQAGTAFLACVVNESGLRERWSSAT